MFWNTRLIWFVSCFLPSADVLWFLVVLLFLKLSLFLRNFDFLSSYLNFIVTKMNSWYIILILVRTTHISMEYVWTCQLYLSTVTLFRFSTLDSQWFTRHFLILLLCRFIISFYIVYFNSNNQKCKNTVGFMSLDLCLIWLSPVAFIFLEFDFLTWC